MTTPIVPNITDEQLDAIEAQASKARAHGVISGLNIHPDTLARLVARLRAAEKDAARYRFIRSEDTKPGFLSSCPERAIYIDEYLVCESVMDARIDKAMEQQP